MALEATTAINPRAKLVIRNIGLLLSGDITRPILDADTVVAVGGRITVFGREADVDTGHATTVIDAHGSGLAPGLIDSHVHPVAGDWTPRQSQLNWINSTLHGGVTTMVSAGEVHPDQLAGIVGVAVASARLARMNVAHHRAGVAADAVVTGKAAVAFRIRHSVLPHSEGCLYTNVRSVIQTRYVKPCERAGIIVANSLGAAMCVRIQALDRDRPDRNLRYDTSRRLR